ncbi:ankyrin repeat domain-containing protein [Lampropedia aestuarii]|nr:ankyrin repeat domain-containing protein [Lampropedia aestuarii]
MFKDNSPEYFFEGKYLDMAQAILLEDIEALQKNSLGEDLNHKGRNGMNLMWFAILNEKFSMVKALVELGVNPDLQVNGEADSALNFSFGSNDLRFLKAILDGGFDPNYYYRPGNDPLMLQRAVGGSLDHVKLLLLYGTRLDDRDTLGRTALEEAIQWRKPKIAAYLVEEGADFNTRDVNGIYLSWRVKSMIDKGFPGDYLHEEFEKLRDLLISKGMQWPPCSPESVREKMRERGEPIGMPQNNTPSNPWPPQ